MAALAPLDKRPTSLGEIVQDAIRDAIVSRRLSPGSRITEAALAEQLAVSKTPVREALIKLEYIGLIESDGGRGGKIVVPSRETIRSAYELRAGLETQAVRLLAERNGEKAIAKARYNAEFCLAAAKKDDRSEFREFDRAFHFSLAEATGNPLLARFIRDAFDLTWTLRDLDLPATDDSLDCAQQHMRVMVAIETGGPQAAEDAMRAHIDFVQNLVLTTFERAGRA